MPRAATTIEGTHQSPLCQQCGTCCVAPDISTLGKPAGVRCRHLADDLRCAIYADRPPVCRGYRPDELCRLVAAPTLDERVRAYRMLFAQDQPEKDCNVKVPSANSA